MTSRSCFLDGVFKLRPLLKSLKAPLMKNVSDERRVSFFWCSLLTDVTQTAVTLPQTQPLVVFAAPGLHGTTSR